MCCRCIHLVISIDRLPGVIEIYSVDGCLLYRGPTQLNVTHLRLCIYSRVIIVRVSYGDWVESRRVDLGCNRCVYQSLAFMFNEAENESLQTFTLTDLYYGLPVPSVNLMFIS